MAIFGEYLATDFKKLGRGVAEKFWHRWKLKDKLRTDFKR